MPLTVSGFKAAFPEFTDAPDSLVTIHLGYAQTRVPSSIWGDSTEEGTYLWTAKLLCDSPYARKIGMVDARNGGETPYDRRLDRLLKAVVPRAVAV